MLAHKDKRTELDATLPPALTDALNSRRLLIFCGAGVSMLPPSSLPNWLGFNQSLLEAAKRATLQEFPELPLVVVEKIRDLSLDQLSVESFSDTLVQTFAGEGYFSVLEVLDSNFPNPNHQAFAELARHRIVRAFVSTNFDTLIERSFRMAAVPLRVFVSEQDYETEELNGQWCALYKIHGSVTASSSLVDTVTQKLQGLSLHVRVRLKSLFREHHVLVLGYSGADLSFGKDYLTFSAITADGPGITWLVRPGSSLSEHVKQVVDRAGSQGAIVEGELPNFFEKLGIAVNQPPYDASKDAQERAEKQARERIQEFFAQEYVGPFSSAAFCENLLRRIGDEATADAILQALASRFKSGEALPVSASVAYRRLAIGAMDKRDFERATYWSQRELKFHDGIAKVYKDRNIPVPRAVLLERKKNLVGVWNNLGLCALHQGNTDTARSALENAKQLAEEVNNFRLLSLVYLNLAKLAEACAEHPDHVLGLLQTSRAFALNSGMGQTLNQANHREAETLKSIAEYDGALTALQRAQPYAQLVGHLEEQVALDLTHAEIAICRGEIENARERLRHCLQVTKDHGAPGLVAKIRWQFCFLLGFYPPLREEILDALNQLLEEYPDLTSSPNRTASGLPTAEFIQEWRDLLASDGIPELPTIILSFPDQKDPEWEIRELLARLEFHGEKEALPACFHQLCSLKYKGNEPARLHDLAEAYLAAAERANDPHSRALAFNFLGIARDLLGDLTGSVKAYQEALKAYSGTSLETQLQIKQNIALVKSKLGEDAESEALFHGVIKDFTAQGDMDNATRAMRNLAEHYARKGQLQGAINQIQVALSCCDQVENPSARPTLERLLAIWEQRRKVREETRTSDHSQHVKLILDMPEETGSIDKEQLAAMREQVESTEELGNLGLTASDSGHMEEARAFTEEAMARYEADGNRLGVSRCWNNFASIAAADGLWHEAINHSNSALAIRNAIGDIHGQILTLANIASYCVAARDYTQARDYARRCLILAEGRRPSRPVAIAWYVLATANRALEKMSEALDAARHFADLLRSIDAPDLGPIREIHAEMISRSERSPTQTYEPPLSPVGAGLEEAERLTRIGDFDGACAILDHLASSNYTTEEKARILGDKANVLQSAGRHEEAVSAYRGAAKLFREVDMPALAIQAECQGAVSLREQGDLAGAESWLRCLLQDLPPGPKRAQVLQTLANTLFHVVVKELEEGEPATRRFDEIYNLYDEARDMPGLSDEDKGLLELNIANPLLWEGKMEDALEKLLLAREYLLRCNSRHLEICEQAIRQVEALASRNTPPAP